MLAFTMDPVTPQETADPARRGASRAAGRVRPRVGNGVARAASVVGWLGLAVAGAALVLIAAVAPAPRTLAGDGRGQHGVTSAPGGPAAARPSRRNSQGQ